VANIPSDLQYTEEHEYVRKGKDGNVEIGITDYAQGELGDIVFVNLPKKGEKFAEHGSFGTIEAVKAVSELYLPIAGTVMEVNAALEADPAVINRDPYEGGWMVSIKVDPDHLAKLMKADDYKKLIGG
jgi:glycine cleavage system H protein